MMTTAGTPAPSRPTTSPLPLRWFWITICLVGWSLLGFRSPEAGAASGSNEAIGSREHLQRFYWGFGRESDQDVDDWPDGWKRYKGPGYPSYLNVAIAPRDPSKEQQFRTLDTNIMRGWRALRENYPGIPLPPSIADMMVDRYLRIDLDGGQVKLQSPAMPASRMYKYRFSCQVMTQGLRHSAARAELVFTDTKEDDATDLAVYSTPRITGNTRWAPVELELVRPPVGANWMVVRLMVERSEDGLEDIFGTIGFDEIRIDQFPQLRITTDRQLGVYELGQPIDTTATIMGMPAGASEIAFTLIDSNGHPFAQQQLPVKRREQSVSRADDSSDESQADYMVTWRLPRLDPGYYLINASLVGQDMSTLTAQTTVGVIDPSIGGTPHGSFGWTLPDRNSEIEPRDFAPWLASLGVAWAKIPAWLAPDDNEGAERIALVFSKLQDSGIQTIGMLDVPPESELEKYALRGRRDMVAAQLFRDRATWQPLLEPVMSRLSLKVRTWQLGAERDFSFMGRPRLRDSISQIATGLQGFGQPIDVTISWPWLEKELPHSEASWQAVCRSADPPLTAAELDAFLELRHRESRSDGPRTWVLLDPIPANRYSREDRIRDLVMRMATVRSHRVQAAFVTDPRDPQRGLLQSNGRPAELLLPWRTTSRLIGNLRRIGSLQLRSGAQNHVFADDNRAVIMVWSDQPTEERIYLGDDVRQVNVWGKVTPLKLQPDPRQPYHTVQIGPVPTFIIGADPTLLAFRMSVEFEQDQLDSYLGQKQKLTLRFTNPTRESLIGQLQLLPPASWLVESRERGWEALGGRSSSHDFEVVLTNTATIGQYEVPIQFAIDAVPPRLLTVYRTVKVGPKNLEFSVTTRLLASGDLRVQIEITNNGDRTESYNCMLFPKSQGREYQRRFISVEPGQTIRRNIYWPDGADLIGKEMVLRAAEQEGRRVVNYSIEVRR